MRKGIGALNTWATLQNPARVAADGGGATDTYSDVVGLWIGIEPMSINGRFQNYAASVTATHVVKARSDSRITIGSRFAVGARQLYVRAEMLGDKGYRFFSCEEVI